MYYRLFVNGIQQDTLLKASSGREALLLAAEIADEGKTYRIARVTVNNPLTSYETSKSIVIEYTK